MIFLYGPPGSGKTSLGEILAEHLNLPFVDLDWEIVDRSGATIPEIFAQQGETGFRQIEKAVLNQILRGERKVIALGGGSLLDPENRRLVEEQGRVVCLRASPDQILQRLEAEPGPRPLLAGDAHLRLQRLLAERGDHYTSFLIQINTDHKSLDEVSGLVQISLGEFHVRGMHAGYDVQVSEGGLESIGDLLTERGLRGQLAVVSDTNVSAIYGERVCRILEQAGFQPFLVPIAAGEQHKTLETVSDLWDRFIALGLDRSSTVIALGGGVTGDLAGFAAATFLRGISWVALPTTLLAMVDASLGGKTGFDLAQGKNLVGAFYSPRLVLSDPLTLDTLPLAEVRSGMAEVIKSGIIADPALFDLCSQGWKTVRGCIGEVISRGIAVKVYLIQADPYEKGPRAALNLGHTVGHALELVSGYRLSHGEAVAVGMVVEARLSEALGLAKPGLSQVISAVLEKFKLPIRVPPELDVQSILSGMRVDKKSISGELRFALPVDIGQVRVGVRVTGDDLITLKRIMEADR
jgi:3-dehydroquinate synthase